MAWKRMECLEVETMSLSEGLLWNVIEKERPMMAPRILAWVLGRMKLTFTEKGRTGEEADHGGKSKVWSHGQFEIPTGHSIEGSWMWVWGSVQGSGQVTQFRGGGVIFNKIFLTEGSVGLNLCIQQRTRGSMCNHSGNKKQKLRVKIRQMFKE